MTRYLEAVRGVIGCTFPCFLRSRDLDANNETGVAWYSLPRCIACEAVVPPFFLRIEAKTPSDGACV